MRKSGFKDLRHIRVLFSVLEYTVSGFVSLQEQLYRKRASPVGFQRVEALLLAKGIMTYFAGPSGEFCLVVGQ